MSVEQWGILALVVLLPLLEGVARLRRSHARPGEATDRIDEMRTSQRGTPPSLPPSLPRPPSPPAQSRSELPARDASSFKHSAGFEPHTSTGKPSTGEEVVQWLRPVRNLRRAIVVATILGPPTQ